MRISIIGAGEMGGAFAMGLLKGTIFQPSEITVSNRHEDKLSPFARLGAGVTTDNRAAADGADIVAIVVKPDVVHTVVEELKPILDYSRQVIVNMAASISIAELEQWFDKDGEVPGIFQVLPNIGIEERASMSFITPNTKGSADSAKVQRIFDDLGRTMLVNERLLNSGNALAGCGIAYAMRYVRAAAEAGVELGFSGKDATGIILQTMEGAVKLLKASGNHPEAEIDKVTTPGGMTIRGLNTMEKYGFSNAVIEGIKAPLKPKA